MHAVTLAEAKEQLTQLIAEARAGGEVIILQDDVPAVKLVPVARPGFGSLRDKVRMSEDFDAPLDDFSDYTP